MMFEISPSPVSAVIVTQAVMSVPALVMKIFEPSITHSPSSSRAVVRVAPASDPAFGSVRPNAASFLPEARSGTHCRFCSSVPKYQIGNVPSEWCAATVIATDESTRASSSTAIAYASVSVPPPPSSSGIVIPIRPSSAISATSSYGKRFSRSSSSATGATFSSANCRTVSRIRRCSSSRSKSRLIPAPAPAKPVPPLLSSLRRAYGSQERVGEVDDEPDAVACAALVERVVRTGAPEVRRADVEVRPRPLAGELAQELRCEDRAPLAQLRGVLQVREARVDVAPVPRVQREAADELAARPRRALDRLGQRFVVAEPPRVQVAQRERHRARERREVDEVRRAVRAGEVQRVGEDQPPFGVRVDDLDRLPVRGAEDVTRLERPSVLHVLGRGDDGHDADRQPELGDRSRRLDHGRAAAHVAFQVLHPQRLLQRDAARVERDRLSDEPEQ